MVKRPVLDTLDQQGAAGAGGAAGGDDTPALPAALEFIEQCACHDRARRTHRMPQGNHATVHIQLVLRNIEFLPAFHHRGGECLVQLEQVQVRRGQFLPLHQPAGGRDAAGQYLQRVVAGCRRVDDARTRFDTQHLAQLFITQQ